MTGGTYQFLSKIKAKHPNETIILMQNNENAVLMHETVKKTIFSMPRSYEVIDSFGSLEEARFATLNNIPVTEEERPLFEYRFKNTKTVFETLPGFIAIRVLRPLKEHTYVILILWENEKFFKDWQSTPAYETFFSNASTNSKQAQLFMGSSYIKTYIIPEDS